MEKSQNNGFRFLPIRLLRFSYDNENGFSFGIYDESSGGYPCCGYIDPDDFYGVCTSRMICGIWLR